MATAPKKFESEAKFVKETKGYKVFETDSRKVTPIYLSHDACNELGITDKLKVTIEAG